MRFIQFVFILAAIGLHITGCHKNEGSSAPAAAVTAENKPTFVPAPMGTETPDAAPTAVPDAEKKTKTAHDSVEQKELSYTELVAKDLKEALQGDFRYQDTGLNQGSKSFSFTNLYCANGLDCRSKYLSISWSDVNGSSFSCSGVRIANDLILTNSHCMELIAQTANTPFRGAAQVVIPLASKTSNLEIRDLAHISNLVMISPRAIKAPVNRPDWAIAKVKSFNKFFADGLVIPKINREGIKDGETYFVYSPSPYADAAEPRAIEKRACKALYRTVFGASFDRKFNSVIVLSDCPIGPGNSGAPIYNSKDELVGIIGGQLGPDLIRSFSAVTTLDFGMLDNGPFNNVGWGMNIACIPDLDAPAPLPEDCNASHGQTTSKVSIPSELAESARKALEATPEGPKAFEFNVVSSDLTGIPLQMIAQAMFVKAPICVKAEALKDLAPESLNFQVSFIGVALDENGALLNKLGQMQTVDAKLETDLDALKSGSTVDFRISLKGSDLPVHMGKLGLCGRP